MSTDKEAFADRLRRVVERAGGIPEIARIAGVSTQSVYGWLAGSKPYRDRVTRICLAVGIREEWLWSGKGKEESTGEDSPRLEESHNLARAEDSEVSERLAEMIISFGDVPPAFVQNAACEIAQYYAEFRRRAEIRAARKKQNS